MAIESSSNDGNDLGAADRTLESFAEAFDQLAALFRAVGVASDSAIAGAVGTADVCDAGNMARLGAVTAQQRAMDIGGLIGKMAFR